MKKTFIALLIIVVLLSSLCSCDIFNNNSQLQFETTTTETIETTTEQTTESTTEQLVLYVVNCQKSITLRLTADTNAAEITQIPFGSAVFYLENAENGFYKVKYQNQEGYALSKYLSATPKERVTTITTYINLDSYETYYVVNCKKSITLRSSPTLSASAITQIPLGASVKFIEVSNNGFYKIAYKNQIGYSLQNYLSSTQNNNKNYNYMVVVNCKKCISLRNAPSTKAPKICDIYLGETVYFVNSAENGFYQITYNGKTGYALSDYLAWD